MRLLTSSWRLAWASRNLACSSATFCSTSSTSSAPSSSSTSSSCRAVQHSVDSKAQSLCSFKRRPVLPETASLGDRPWRTARPAQAFGVFALGSAGQAAPYTTPALGALPRSWLLHHAPPGRIHQCPQIPRPRRPPWLQRLGHDTCLFSTADQGVERTVCRAKCVTPCSETRSQHPCHTQWVKAGQIKVWLPRSHV